MMSTDFRLLRAIVYTSITMLAFAFNSILCRMALRDGAIDPASFTSIRLLSGAVALLLIVQLTSRKSSIRDHGGWTSAFVLFFYAICFSYAYISLSAMQAALVQLTVPAIAAIGGVMLLAESISLRLLISGALILGGITLALVQKSHRVTDS